MTYPTPAHGWTCFHCGETLTTPGAAQDHFGKTPDCVPGCLIKAGEERGLLMALRRTEAERDEALAQRNRASDEATVAASSVATVLRMVPGAKSTHDVRCELDSLQGRVHSAEAVLRAVHAAAPDIYQAACVTASGPGTYYAPRPVAESELTGAIPQ